VVAQPSKKSKTIHVRHFQISQNDIRQRELLPVGKRTYPAQVLDGFFGAVNRVNVVGYASLLRCLLSEKSIVLLIVNQQNVESATSQDVKSYYRLTSGLQWA